MARLSLAGSLAILGLSLTTPLFAQAQQGAARGQMTPEQRQAARQARGTAVVQRLDKNGDGSVSRDEWARNPQAFNRLDSDKDGLLSADEFAKAPTFGQVRMRRVRMMMLRQRMRRMDANADGRISRTEWKGQPDRFDTLDQNKDGFLTPAELRKR